MNKIKYTLAFLCGLFLLTGCHEEGYTGGGLSGKGISLQCVPTRIGLFGAASRAAGDPGDQMTNAEKRISSLDIFLFDSEGNYLENVPESSVGFQGYKHFEGNSNWVLSNDLFADQAKARNATIYVLANLESGTLSMQGGGKYPYLRMSDGDYQEVTNRSVLDSYVYIPRNLPEDGGIPAAGLPMYSITVADLSYTRDGGGKLLQIPLQSLMARVDVSIRLVVPNIEDISEDGRFPNYASQQFNVMNVPTGTKFNPTVEGTETTGAVTNLEMSWPNAAITHNGASISKRFYMFEHHRQPTQVPQYPADIEEAHKQRYKPQFAKDDAVYVDLCGMFTNKNAYAYDVDYKLYLGGNATDNYVVTRNRQYKNNITVRGITATDDPENEGTISLDTRVNITETEPYYISMLRERNHDAHFNVTPMDIYVLLHEGYVTVELEDKTIDWLRLDYVGHVDTFGEKKRRQFTTALMDELSNESTGHGVGPYAVYDQGAEDPNHPGELGYGERIYLYLDENLEVDAQQNGVDRETNLIIKYYDGTNPDPISERKLLIRQKGLWKLEVQGDWGGAPRKTVWAEVYEEYANHFDPRDNYNVTYDGLPWGASGQNVGINGNETETFMNGESNTRIIINTFYGQSANGFELNDIPTTAAEYCYNKNIRQPDGSVSEIKWYLPAITEMEAIVKQYAADEQRFVEQLYWSSSVDYQSGWQGGSLQYARSTMATWNGNEWTHVESDPTEGRDGGRKQRSELLRIRALRKDLNPVR